MQEDSPTTAEPVAEVCYRHPLVQTGVHCTRCGKPICPNCMIPAPVGYQCPDCVGRARREFRSGPGRRIQVARVKGISATSVLLVSILGMFALEVFVAGGRSLLAGPSPQTMFDLGALAPPAVAIDGQYWRFFTSMFLHVGLWHVGFNSYALWIFGNQMESAYGRWTFVVVYFVTGFIGGVAAYLFASPFAVSAGASGAIFGLFGAFLAYNYRRRHTAAAALNLRWALTIILLNVFITLTIPGIGYQAHIGGLIAGLLCGRLIDGVGPHDRQKVIQWAGILAIVVVGAALVIWRGAEVRSAIETAVRIQFNR